MTFPPGSRTGAKNARIGFSACSCCDCATVGSLRHRLSLVNFADDPSVFWRGDRARLIAIAALVGRRKAYIHFLAPRDRERVWDLHCKRQGKPIWGLAMRDDTGELVACVDFRYLGM